MSTSASPSVPRSPSSTLLLGLACLVSCAAPRPSAPGALAPVHASGPVTVDPTNPRYFAWKGKTQVLVGSTEHYGAVINPSFDFETYLETVKRAGLNHVRIFLGDYIEDSRAFHIAENTLEPAAGTALAPWARSEVPGAADGGKKFDLDRWDDRYFSRLHAFMRAAARRELVVEAVLFFVGPCWSRAPMNHVNNLNGTTALDARRVLTLDNGNLLARQAAYARKLTAELNEYDNLIFDLVNEPWFDNQARPGFTSEAPRATLEWMRVASGWIREREASLPKRHVVTADVSNRGVGLRAEDLRAGYTNLDGFNVHYDSFGLSLLFNRGISKPFGFNETGFQGTGDAPYLVDAWRYLMMGGALYDHLDYSFTLARPDGTHRPSFPVPGYTGGGSAELRARLAALLRFMDALPLAHMQPDDGFLVDFTGEAAREHHVLSWPGNVYAAFFPGEGPVVASVLLPKGPWTVQWIDMATGGVERSHELTAKRWAHPLEPHPRHDGGAVLRICAAGGGPCLASP